MTQPCFAAIALLVLSLSAHSSSAADLIADYFEMRRSLRGLFLIVDIRRQLTDYDRQMLGFAESVGLPTHVLLTKADKLKRGQAAAALLAVRRDLADTASVQQFSALSRLGEDEARLKLEQYLAREPE